MGFTNHNTEFEKEVYEALSNTALTESDLLSTIRDKGISFRKIKTSSLEKGTVIKTAKSFFELKSFIDIFSIDYGNMDKDEDDEELKPDYMLLQYTPDEALVRKSNHDIWAIGKLGDNIFKITRVWDIQAPIGAT